MGHKERFARDCPVRQQVLALARLSVEIRIFNTVPGLFGRGYARDGTGRVSCVRLYRRSARVFSGGDIDGTARGPELVIRLEPRCGIRDGICRRVGHASNASWNECRRSDRGARPQLYANPNNLSCSCQARGRREDLISLSAVRCGGCRPPRIASVIRGARKARRNTRVT